MNEPFVADSSVGVAWCVAAQATQDTDALRSSLGAGGEFVVPGLWFLEVSNTLLVLLRRGKIGAAEFHRARDHVRNLEFILDDDTAFRAWGHILPLAEKHSLSTYDATYLDLAIRRGLPLASRNAALNKAAKKCGVVTLL